MAITVEAIYENGVLKPVTPLPFQEHERVQIQVQSQKSALLENYGILGWKGDAATLEQIALDPEFLPEEAK